MSWGTKGSDKADVLPTVSSKKNKDGDQAVVEETARVQEDLDAVFKETVTRAVTKVEVKEEVEKPTLDDQNKTFRTRLVACWMLTNAGLAVAIENINGLVDTTNSKEIIEEEAQLRTKQNDYFAFILYATFGLSLIRFIGVSVLRLYTFAHADMPSAVPILPVQAQLVQVFPQGMSTSRMTYRVARLALDSFSI